VSKIIQKCVLCLELFAEWWMDDVAEYICGCWIQTTPKHYWKRIRNSWWWWTNEICDPVYEILTCLRTNRYKNKKLWLQMLFCVVSVPNRLDLSRLLFLNVCLIVSDHVGRVRLKIETSNLATEEKLGYATTWKPLLISK
jgi:hypothetical protein